METTENLHSQNRSTKWTSVPVMNWEDYLVVISVVGVLTLTGALFGCFKCKPRSAEEYFFANRQMFVIPVIFSLLCSFMSGVGLIQLSGEIYFYGTQCTLILISFVPATFTLVYLYIPVYFNLQLSSVFEYFELRFSSRLIRIVTSFLGIASTVVYIALVVFGTSAATSELLGIHVHLLAAVILAVCVIPSTLGGLKVVVWTGALQALVLLVSLSALIGLGVSKVENLSFDIIWERALESNRIEFLNADADPRVRHTFWTSIVGGYFLCMSLFAGTQGQVQRFVSLPTLAKSKLALVLSMVLFTMMTLLIFISGLFLVANYFDCTDSHLPSTATASQIYMKFTTEVFATFPAITGLLVSGFICSSLSSISNSLNSIACTATNDYFQHWIPNISEKSLVFLSKALTVTFGSVAFGLVFVAENLEMFILDAWSIFVVITATLFGTFTLGMFFPWANSKGALLGLIASLSITMYIIFVRTTFEQIGEGIPDQRLRFPTLNCSNLNNTRDIGVDNFFIPEPDIPYIPKLSSSTSLRWKIESSNTDDSFLIHVVSISPMWYPAISCLLTIIFGLFFSLLFVKWESNWRVRPDCMSPPFLKFWFKCFPNHMKKWIEPDENLVLLCSSSFSVMPRDSKDFKFSKEPLCDVKFNPIF